ncbi:MAG TPA: DUF2336 domain-containing protein [Xanthobacteraceae bacterium]|nr:DUF2336 domain-containing protein [Xanthobacteraceae bacterium]
MSEIVSLIPDLEHLLRHSSDARRSETLRRITDLFLEDAGRFGPEHIELFDDVFTRLVIEIETEARALLAQRLAPCANAPERVVTQLACDDDIKVAGPVLLQSGRLRDDDLIAIAKTKSQAHLLAIAGRPRVNPALTDVLVGRGDSTVVNNVAANPGARFSEAGFTALFRRAERDEGLIAAVGRRTDIPPRLFRSLLIQATEVVQRRLLATARPDAQAEIRRILAGVANEIGAKTAAVRNYAAAQQTIDALRAQGRLAEAELSEFARAGRYEETVAALSALCGVRIETVDRLLGGERSDPVLILCKALGVEWPTARAIIAVHAGKRLVSPQLFDSAHTNFERLSSGTAQRVLKFWQRRETNQSTPD